MGIKFSNFSKAKLATPPSGTSGLTFTVEAGKGALFASLGAGDYEYLTLYDAAGNQEIVKVEARSTDSFTIAAAGRGLDGTTARTWLAGDFVACKLVRIVMDELIASDSSNAAAILAHINDTVAAHAASAISYAGSANLAATDVEAALDELDAEKAGSTLANTFTAKQTFTKAIETAKGANVASASTCDVWTPADGNLVHITGTTTITSFGTAPQAGARRSCIADAAFTITYNATTLKTPGSADLYVPAGSTFDVVADTTANMVVKNFDDRSVQKTITGACKNLAVTINATNPTYKLDITCDEIILKNASKNQYIAESVSVTVDITTSGANGLDTGSEASNTWYYLWLIYNGTTVAALLSTSSTAPTMPSGYTFKALISAIRNDGSSNFIAMHQINGEVWTTDTNVASNVTLSTSWASVSLSSIIPPNAKTVSGHVYDTAQSNNFSVHVASKSDGFGIQAFSIPAASASAGFGTDYISTFQRVPITTAQTIYWKTDTGFQTNSKYMSIIGFTLW